MEYQNIHIFYFSGWKEPKIHFGFANSKEPWKTISLLKYPNYREIWCIEIPVPSQQFTMEFVFCNNDMTDWDHPSPTKHQPLHENYQISSIGSYFIYTGKQLQVTEEFVTNSTSHLSDSVARIMVITDLDGTLFEDNEKGRKALKNFNSFWLRKLAFAKDQSLKPVLVYSTGRDWQLFSKLQREAYLLWPEYFIGGTGTFIYKYNGQNDKYELDQEWAQIIKQNWDFDLIAERFDKLKGFERQSNDPNIDKSNLHYNCEPQDLQLNQQEIEIIKFELAKLDIKFNLIASGPDNIRYIDITSFHANKGKAMEYLAKKLNFSLKDVFSFGDSMNDIDMLAKSKGGSYLVANSQEEIVKWMRMNQKKKSFNVKQSEYEYADALYHTLSQYYYEQS